MSATQAPAAPTTAGVLTDDGLVLPLIQCLTWRWEDLWSPARSVVGFAEDIVQPRWYASHQM